MRSHTLALLLGFTVLIAPACTPGTTPGSTPGNTPGTPPAARSIDPATAPTLRLGELAVAIQTDDFARALALLDDLDAAAEARLALTAGDRRLLSLAGLGPVIPGLTANPADAPRHPTWLLPATDSLTDHAAYQRQAFHFAQAYNEAILAADAGKKSGVRSQEPE